MQIKKNTKFAKQKKQKNKKTQNLRNKKKQKNKKTQKLTKQKSKKRKNSQKSKNLIDFSAILVYTINNGSIAQLVRVLA